MTFIGVGADVQIAVYTFTYLDKTVRRLCREYMTLRVSDTVVGRHRELIRQSYYLGAISTINRRLTEQKRKTPVTPGALVPVKEGLIRQAISDMGRIRTVRNRKSYINSGAFSQGETDGNSVGIHRGIESERSRNELFYDL